MRDRVTGVAVVCGLVVTAWLCGGGMATAADAVPTATPAPAQPPAQSPAQSPAQAQAAARAAFDREDYDAAFAAYRALADAPPDRIDGEVAYRLGQMTRFGWGTGKDLPAAVRWLHLAAERDHAEAQAELGKMYRDGRGVPADDEQAARWLTRAAQAGVGIAQLNLGRMYKDGAGVPRDLVEAYAWFTLAAANGYVDGLSYRNRLLDRMSAADVSLAEQRVVERNGTAGARPARTAQ
jgi:TPR repeat protein